MKKVILIIIGLYYLGVNAQTSIEVPKCVSCKGNQISNISSALGVSNTAVGQSSFASGKLNLSEGDYSTTVGYNNSATGMYSFAGGQESVASNKWAFAYGERATAQGFRSFAQGMDVTAFGGNSVAIGRYVKTTTSNAMVIGIGNDISNYLENNTNGSLIVGFYSNQATFYVGPSQSSNSFGKVGIGTTNPSKTLEVNGTFKVNNWSYLKTIVLDNSDIKNINQLSGDGGLKFKGTIQTNTQMILTEDGKLGLGTLTPSYLLDIAGTMNVSDAATFGNDLQVSGTITGNYFVGDGSQLTNLPGDNLGNHTATQNIKLNNHWISGDGNDEGVFVDNDGNVGIGTDTPNSKFDVDGKLTIRNSATIGSGINKLSIGPAFTSALGWGNAYLGFNIERLDANNWVTTVSPGSGSHGGASVIYGNPFGDLIFVSLDGEGTGAQVFTDEEIHDNATMILRRDGVLKTNEVLVKTDVWSDYVFHSDYNLMPLDEVEDYIANYKHLPEVPTESEVIKNGIKLGEMDALLLKKIEELTMYVIEIKKENELIKQENKNLYERIKKLEK